MQRMPLLLISLWIVGCADFKPLQPPPPAYELWSKAGSTSIEVAKAMLECGYPSPQGAGGFSANDVALIHLCMKSDGYSYEDGRGDICDGWKERPPACSPGTASPRRDVNRRLNSTFCTKNHASAVCQSN